MVAKDGGENTDNQRDIIWKDSFNTYYDTYFDELLTESLSQRWTIINTTIKFLVAITATTSVVAGLALWQEAGWKTFWAVFSLIAAVASVFGAVVVVENFVKDHTKSNKDFTNCRHELENFRHDLDMDPYFDVTSKDKEFKAIKKKYDDCDNSSARDWTVTMKFKLKIKKQLNELLHGEISKIND